MLITVAYASRSLVDGDLGEIEKLRLVSQVNNKANLITGALYFDHDTFFQILEGEAEDVDALYQTVTADNRHTDVKRLVRCEIESRSMPLWSMKFVSGAASPLLAGDFRYDDLIRSDASVLKRRAGLLHAA
ncbi:MAG: BLUF domain-containing protein [Pseudomonadota bacterium]